MTSTCGGVRRLRRVVEQDATASEWLVVGEQGRGLPPLSVDSDATAHAGRSACELAQELSRVRAVWSGVTDTHGEACGYRETTDAYVATQDRWFDELGVYIRVLEELCQAIQASAGGYQASDTQAADDLRGRV